MSRLPTPGQDNGNWGEILNDFLDQSHNADGSLKESAIPKSTDVTTDGSSDTKVPSVKAVKTYTDSKVGEVNTQLDANAQVLSINKFDKSKATTGKYLSDVDAEITEATLGHSDYIPCLPGQLIVMRNCTGFYAGCVYDAAKTRLVSLSGTDGQDFVYYIPTTVAAAYVRLNFYVSLINTQMVMIGDPAPVLYASYGDYKPFRNPLYKKTALYNGDSIMAAAATGVIGWPKLISGRNGMAFVNYAQGGGTIAYVDAERYCISRNITVMQSSADYVILQGGVNDSWLSVPLGSLSSGYSATLDDTTFYGAMENMLKQAILKWPSKKIGFVVSHRIYNAIMDTYWAAARECCEKWSVSYLDLYKASGFALDIEAQRTAYTTSGDGCHPLLNMYLALTSKIEAWMRSL